jgi:hypothetical protein
MMGCSKNRTKPELVRGVRNLPLLTAVDISHITLPTLHIQLGLINALWDALMVEIQAAMEQYTVKYLFLENELNLSKEEASSSLVTRDAFQATATKEKPILKDRLKALRGISPEDQMAIQALEASIKLITATTNRVIQDRKNAVLKLRAAKSRFEAEARRPENSKSAGQPIRAAIEQFMKHEHGIDKGVYFGGDFQGRECRALMTSRHEIFDSLSSFVNERKYCLIVDEAKLRSMLFAYERLLGHFDAIFSICRVKRYHLENGMLESLKGHVLQVSAVWRALGLSITPKMHCVEHHLVDLVKSFGGVGDLGEDEGERGHQTGHRNECRTRALRDHAKKAVSHVRHESMAMHPEVREIKDHVLASSKRKRKREVECKGNLNARIAKEKREHGRSQLLCLPVQSEPVPLLTELRKEALRSMTLVDTEDH